MPCVLGTACVDLDGVLLYHRSEWGNSLLGLVLPLGLKLCQLLNRRWAIVVFTARPKAQHADIEEYLKLHRVPFSDVTNVKPPADAYFDDKAYRIPKNWK